jgi:hypothetical protein
MAKLLYFALSFEYLIKKAPVPTKRATVSLIKVKSYTALLLVLLLCIRSYLKSILRRKFLILVTYHLDTLYLQKQGCKDPFFFEANGGPRAKNFGKHSPKWSSPSVQKPLFDLTMIQMKTADILTTFFPEINFRIF